MARTQQQILEQMIGNQAVVIAGLQAQLEVAQERIQALEAERRETQPVPRLVPVGG